MDMCVICQEPLDAHHDEGTYKLVCGHVYGRACLYKWARTQSTQQGFVACPLCRCPMQGPETHILYALHHASGVLRTAWLHDFVEKVAES